MGRVSREHILAPGAYFHATYRCIDGDHMLKNDEHKKMLLNSMFKFQPRVAGKLDIFSYCITDNHYHKGAGLREGEASPVYSNFIRSVHSSFARKLNNKLKRKGPVGQDRPHTRAIQDEEYLKTVMFYGDYQMVKAKVVKDPALWPYSSYNFYAFGKENEWTSMLTKPQWYIDGGDTDEERQKNYRVEYAWFVTKKLPEFEQLMEELHALGDSFFTEAHARDMAFILRTSTGKILAPEELRTLLRRRNRLPALPLRHLSLLNRPASDRTPGLPQTDGTGNPEAPADAAAATGPP